MVEVQTFAFADEWARFAAARLSDALNLGLRDPAQNGWAVFAGAGGSTPELIYRNLVKMRSFEDWQHTFVTLVDERYVPETSPESNAGLIKRTLMTGAARQAEFLPLYSSQVTVDRAAALAAHRLHAELDGRRLDAVLLGMGEDGHICSMFPGNPALRSLLSPGLRPTVFGVAAGRDGMAPSMERLSLNLPWLIQARRVVLALTGAKKREVFEQQAAGDPRTHPIAALLTHGAPLEVVWTEAA